MSRTDQVAFCAGPLSRSAVLELLVTDGVELCVLEQTYSGLFCVAINPYKRFPIYTARAMKIYHGKRRNEVPPHIFAISDGAYQNMLTSKSSSSLSNYEFQNYSS